MTVPTPAQERAYPLPSTPSDRRFTLGLTIDVAKVLVQHGYPAITAGGDLVALQQALFGFLYAPALHAQCPLVCTAQAGIGTTCGEPIHWFDECSRWMHADGYRGHEAIGPVRPQCLPGCYDPTLVADHVEGCPVGAVQSHTDGDDR